MDAMDECIDRMEQEVMRHRPMTGTNENVNRIAREMKEIRKMRVFAMQIRFNAEQFNRRADWMRRTGRSAEEAKGMFPTASGV